MLSRRSSSRSVVYAIAAVLFALGLPACASGPEESSAPDEVVGQPPDEDSEDHEFASPPQHPGDHGSVDGERSSEATSPPADTDPGVVTESQLDELQNHGPSVVMQHIETEPIHDDDEFVGFEVVGATDTARAHMEPKLEIGDIITHVNLVRLERPDDYMEAWQTLDGADEIRFDVIRGDDAREVVIDVE